MITKQTPGRLEFRRWRPVPPTAAVGEAGRPHRRLASMLARRMGSRAALLRAKWSSGRAHSLDHCCRINGGEGGKQRNQDICGHAALLRGPYDQAPDFLRATQRCVNEGAVKPKSLLSPELFSNTVISERTDNMLPVLVQQRCRRAVAPLVVHGVSCPRLGR